MGRIQNKHEHRFHELVDLLIDTAKSRPAFIALLEDLLTNAEQRELGVRLQIIKMLSEGKTQRDISQTLRVGIATVTRGARALRTGKGFQKALRQN